MDKMKSANRESAQNGIWERGKRMAEKGLPDLVNPNHIRQIIFAALICTCIASCNPAKIVTSWRDPEAAINSAQFNKFVVAALLKNQTVRRRTEDRMASYFPGNAVQSYKELGETEWKENNAFYDQKLKGEGFDGIVIIRLLQVDKDKRYVPGYFPEYYRSWGFYYGAASTGFYTPAHYATDKMYDVEVNIYSFKRDKLIWSATTSTVNPAGSDQLYDDVIKVVKKKMKKEGFLE
jgi:hypothetical protein